MPYYVHRGMFIVKSLLRDICRALGPYCTYCNGDKWSVFSYTVTFNNNYKLTLKTVFKLPIACAWLDNLMARLLR